MGECSCWVHYPNPMYKKENGKWKCVDDYECIRDLEIKMTKVGVSCVSGKTHCRRKVKEVDMLRNLIRDGLEEMKKYYPDEKFIIFISPEDGQGGCLLFGEEVIAHPAVKKGTCHIARKKSIDDYLMDHGGNIYE